MQPAALPSNRKFGALFIVVFAILCGIALWHGQPMARWYGIAAGLFALVTLVRPAWLTPLNRAWMGLATILGRIVSPIVLGIMYYGMMVPFGLFMRLSGRDPMHRRLDPQAASYWQPRLPPGPPPESLRNQF
jgi:hypothetical protein